MLSRGDMIEVDGVLAVVVRALGEEGVPEDHVCVWFGDPKAVRISAGGKGSVTPEVWTVPEEVCRPAREAKFLH